MKRIKNIAIKNPEFIEDESDQEFENRMNEEV